MWIDCRVRSVCGNQQIQSFPVQPHSFTGTALPFLAHSAEVFQACGCRTHIIYPRAARPGSEPHWAIRQLHCTQRRILATVFPPGSEPPPAEAFFFSFNFLLLNTTCLSAFQFCAKSYQVLSISLDDKVVPPIQTLRIVPVPNCFDKQSNELTGGTETCEDHLFPPHLPLLFLTLLFLFSIHL